MAERQYANMFVDDTFEHCEEESEIFIEKKPELNDSEDDIFGLNKLKDAILENIPINAVNQIANLAETEVKQFRRRSGPERRRKRSRRRGKHNLIIIVK
jgi:hypothetical protein